MFWTWASPTKLGDGKVDEIRTQRGRRRAAWSRVRVDAELLGAPQVGSVPSYGCSSGRAYGTRCRRARMVRLAFGHRNGNGVRLFHSAAHSGREDDAWAEGPRNVRRCVGIYAG